MPPFGVDVKFQALEKRGNEYLPRRSFVPSVHMVLQSLPWPWKWARGQCVVRLTVKPWTVKEISFFKAMWVHGRQRHSPDTWIITHWCQQLDMLFKFKRNTMKIWIRSEFYSLVPTYGRAHLTQVSVSALENKKTPGVSSWGTLSPFTGSAFTQDACASLPNNVHLACPSGSGKRNPCWNVRDTHSSMR